MGHLQGVRSACCTLGPLRARGGPTATAQSSSDREAGEVKHVGTNYEREREGGKKLTRTKGEGVGVEKSHVLSDSARPAVQTGS